MGAISAAGTMTSGNGLQSAQTDAVLKALVGEVQTHSVALGVGRADVSVGGSRAFRQAASKWGTPHRSDAAATASSPGANPVQPSRVCNHWRGWNR
jgi:hypothetical protein